MKIGAAQFTYLMERPYDRGYSNFIYGKVTITQCKRVAYQQYHRNHYHCLKTNPNKEKNIHLERQPLMAKSRRNLTFLLNSIHRLNDKQIPDNYKLLMAVTVWKVLVVWMRQISHQKRNISVIS